jgi:Uma2 family endonuclease
LAGKSCKVFVAPTDVVLSDLDVIQSDILVVCDKKKITDANIQGAPDLVIEVLSPATALKDRREKKALYEKHGVPEYIIADPISNTVERYLLKNSRYDAPEVFGPQDNLSTHLPDGIEIPLTEIFA